MKGMTVIVLMWEEAAIKDDVIEYDIAFNIIYIIRTHVVVANLRCRLWGCGCFPGLLCCDPKMLPVLHRTHCT
ncbi:hypothetical protein DM054_13665 [Klebsiella pneumoniae]|nr:hypothetical protein CES89_15735 [Klebsiella pneumoniae]OYQ25153.1 hypothetical protein B7475_16000 [Klebsiella pneumoniae]PAX38301.1 hypothetical protein CLI87_13155 [Klebsiella pneumoniae]PBD44272.1 hypothetical protein CK488_22145 [Klebsiella pneumoniae]RAU78705.1 hypothetical protein DM054_13665 [Klebsiella pneumoniae]